VPEPVVPEQNSEFVQRTLIWMIVAIAGFFFGLSFVTGPLCLYQGHKMRAEAVQGGIPNRGFADATFWIGLGTSVFLLLATLFFAITFVASRGGSLFLK
jgi:hypothetical protein